MLFLLHQLFLTHTPALAQKTNNHGHYQQLLLAVFDFNGAGQHE